MWLDLTGLVSYRSAWGSRAKTLLAMPKTLPGSTPSFTSRNNSIPAGGADGEDERDEQAREEAGADWLAEQGFDRKE